MDGSLWVSDRGREDPDRGTFAIVTELDPRTMGSMGSPALMIWKRVNGLGFREQLGRNCCKA